MSWREFTIGKGEHCCSAIILFDTTMFSISHNNSQFWISENEFFDVGFKIFKDTKEGIKLQSLLDKIDMQFKISKEADKINDYLLDLVIKHTNPKQLISAINNLKDKYFELGKQEKQNEFLTLLGLKQK